MEKRDDERSDGDHPKGSGRAAEIGFTSSIRKCNTWDSFYSILSVWETIINTLRLTRGTIFVRFEHQVSL